MQNELGILADRITLLAMGASGPAQGLLSVSDPDIVIPRLLLGREALEQRGRDGVFLGFGVLGREGGGMDPEELVGERGVLLEQKAKLARCFERAEGVCRIGGQRGQRRSGLDVGDLRL